MQLKVCFKNGTKMNMEMRSLSKIPHFQPESEIELVSFEHSTFSKGTYHVGEFISEEGSVIVKDQEEFLYDGESCGRGQDVCINASTMENALALLKKFPCDQLGEFMAV